MPQWRAFSRARLKYLWLKNIFLITSLWLILPIYPVFGSFLYDGRIGNSAYDVDTILAEEQDAPDTSMNKSEILQYFGRDVIVDYIVEPGDTLAQVSLLFNISPNAIRWANNLNTNILTPGRTLVIPPTDKIIYTTKEWDTFESIASQYSTQKHIIQKANRLWDSITPGKMLFIPEGVRPESLLDQYDNNPTWIHVLKVIQPRWAWFTFGHCTYFVAKHWPVTWRWNARYWFKNAANAWFKTGSIAKPWAIVVWYGPGYNLSYGHVGIVISVNREQGTMIIKDMNYSWLWKITTRVEKLSNSQIVWYIYNEKK